ncbi:LexA family protein [Ruthenibacterium lactatiformans]|uniref:LexA family protein n=1 Tax=Ruthenibacterium lactatiformans TaxID=1550024 RepID=UPI0019671551|nr:S24 family peptidase [Ruthenibacterium lactatiformans]MBN3009851.1 helix-turn-helix domain-containing protein [Ruthenibacterium lactatiformans]
MTTGERIKQRRKELGLSAEYLAKKLKVSAATVYRYENGGIEKLPVDILEPLSQALDTTPAYLMGWEVTSKPTEVPPGFEPLPKMKRVPLIGEIACGQPITAEENLEGYVAVPDEWRADFTLTCRGDSMEPRIQNGDIVAIRKQPDVEDGEIAAVRIDCDATLKHVYHYPDRLVLQPENTAFPPIVLVGEEINTVCIEGKAVGLCRGI